MDAVFAAWDRGDLASRSRVQQLPACLKVLTCNGKSNPWPVPRNMPHDRGAMAGGDGLWRTPAPSV